MMKRRWVVLAVGVLTLAPDPGRGQVRVSPETFRRITGRSLRPDTVRIMTPAGIRTALPRADMSYTIPARGYQVVTSDSAVRVVERGAATRYVLPYHLLLGDRATGAPDEPPVRGLRLIAEMEGGGLRFVPQVGRFVGQLYLGLQDSERPASSERLPGAVTVFVTADADAAAPSSLSIEGTNVGYFKPVRIEQIEARDSIRVRVLPEFDPAGVELRLPVRNSRVELRATPERIQGFGLEVARLTATLPAGIRPDGHVLFTSKQAIAEPEQALTGSGVVTSMLRSRGIGVATIIAECKPFMEDTETVEFAWPIAFAVAALLGGLLGGLAAHLRRRDKSKVEWPAYIGSGVIAGFIMGIAYAVGINLLPTTVVANTTITEGAVFVVAALGGVAGVPYLKSLVSKPTKG